MTPFLQLAFALAVILFAAKLSSYISTRLGQPSVLGELLVGLILGPSLLDVLHFSFMTDVHLPEIVNELGELGVLFLMFLAGLDLHFRELARNTRVSAYAGILGVLLPVASGWAVGEILGMSGDQALFLGLSLGATSVSISAQTLMELKVLKSRVGLGLLGAAVFDDILVILLLSSFLALQEGGNGVTQVAVVFLRMLAFFVLSAAVGKWVLPRLVHRLSRLPVSQAPLTFALVVLLLFGLASELIGGMAAITGTFLAGLMFSRTPERADIQNGFRSLAYGFFVPIFFVTVGLGVDLHDLNANTIWVLALITFVAILGKILGAGAGARLARFSWIESLQLGIGLVSRGEVGLIVAKMGFDRGYLSGELFSAIVGMVLITTIITPPMLRAAFHHAQPPAPSLDQTAQP